jgi:hypothetical protein
VKYDARTIEFQVPRSKIVLDAAAHLSTRTSSCGATRGLRRRQADAGGGGDPKLLDRGNQVAGTLMTYELEIPRGHDLPALDRLREGASTTASRSARSATASWTCSTAPTAPATWRRRTITSRPLDEDLPEGQAGGEAGGVLRAQRAAAGAARSGCSRSRPGRHSGFLFPQFELGLNNRAGQFIRNAGYYWAPNDYMDLTCGGDYYQDRPSWVLRADGNYALLYKFVAASAPPSARDESTNQEDWDLDADHRPGDLAAHAAHRARPVRLEPHLQLERSLRRPLAVRLNRFLTSNLSVSHVANWASFSFVVDRRQDWTPDVRPAGRRPRAPIRPGPRLASQPDAVRAQPLGVVPDPHPGHVRVPQEDRAREAALEPLLQPQHPVPEPARAARVRVRHGADQRLDHHAARDIGQQLTVRRGLNTGHRALSDSRRLFGWLNFAPRINANMVVFDFDELGHKVVPAATWSSGASMSSTFYGTFRPSLGPLIGIRHVLFPSVSINYSPDFDGLTYVTRSASRLNKFNGFGGIGDLRLQERLMSLSLDQRLQAKLKHGRQRERIDTC